jgi:hypothetical protein
MRTAALISALAAIAIAAPAGKFVNRRAMTSLRSHVAVSRNDSKLEP